MFTLNVSPSQKSTSWNVFQVATILVGICLKTVVNFLHLIILVQVQKYKWYDITFGTSKEVRKSSAPDKAENKNRFHIICFLKG